jgi:hypothetical protein
MSEREREPNPCWTDDILVGEFPLPGGAAVARLRLHSSAAMVV